MFSNSNDDMLTSSEMTDLSNMWYALSGDAARDNDTDTADEFWVEATLWHNRALAQESF